MCRLDRGQIDLPNGLYTGEDIQHVTKQDEDEKGSDERKKLSRLLLTDYALDQV